MKCPHCGSNITEMDSYCRRCLGLISRPDQGLRPEGPEGATPGATDGDNPAADASADHAAEADGGPPRTDPPAHSRTLRTLVVVALAVVLLASSAFAVAWHRRATLVDRGMACYHAGDYICAYARLAEAQRRRDPAGFELAPCLARADCLEKMGDTEGAIKELVAAAEVRGHAVPAVFARIGLLEWRLYQEASKKSDRHEMAERLAEAIKWYERALPPAGDRYDGIEALDMANQVGAYYTTERIDFPRAFTYLEMAAEIDRKSARALCNLGAAYVRKGQFEHEQGSQQSFESYHEAIKHLDEAIRLWDDEAGRRGRQWSWARPYLERGRAREGIGRIIEAMADYSKAVASQPPELSQVPHTWYEDDRIAREDAQAELNRLIAQGY